MSQQRVQEALQAAEGAYLSGQELSRDLGISRAAVWKAGEALRHQGLPAGGRAGSPHSGDRGAVFDPAKGQFSGAF